MNEIWESFGHRTGRENDPSVFCERSIPSRERRPPACAIMLRYETSCEGTRLEHSQTKPLLFMFSVYSQQQQPSPPTGTKSGSSCGKAVLRSSVPAVGAAMAPATSSTMTAAPYSASAGDAVSAGGGSTSQAAGTGSLTRQALEVCCLEGCGLGWRVRPPLVRRSLA